MQWLLWMTVGALVVLALAAGAGAEPLRLHPDNPHYFLFRGEPTVVIGSGEHYGAVLNLDFDYAKYLEALARDGMGHTRMFVGAYCEQHDDFGIAGNTLAPAAGRFICPWARSDQPGYPNGGSKFDLSRFDPAYFERLRDFVSRAAARGIIVEVNLFCPFYGDSMWHLSPQNPANNVNGLGPATANDSYTLDRNAGLLAIQEAMARRVVEELAEFDNLYYEVMNEPYICSIPMDWQVHLAQVIADAERALGVRHLISLNIANGQAEVKDPAATISILNFHYAWPPDTVGLNYGLNRVIGDNETGFVGTADWPYRREAWAFILAGGGLFSHLDYSFTVGHEDGDFAFPPTQPGGGGPTLRRQFRFLSDFIKRFDFVHLAPAAPVMVGGLPEGVRALGLARTGEEYAVYLCRNDAGEAREVRLALALPAGEYRAEWWDPSSGAKRQEADFTHGGGDCPLVTPPFGEDVALRIVRVP
jgi:hypothetical protein